MTLKIISNFLGVNFFLTHTGRGTYSVTPNRFRLKTDVVNIMSVDV